MSKECISLYFLVDYQNSKDFRKHYCNVMFPHILTDKMVEDLNRNAKMLMLFTDGIGSIKTSCRKKTIIENISAFLTMQLNSLRIFLILIHEHRQKIL